MTMAVQYDELCKQLAGITEGERHPVPNMANAAALLWQALPDINWAGFYTLQEEDYLLLAPFQGKPACIRIPVGRGVCGTAVAENKTQLVKDVHAFPGHIACDAASASEIVVPLHDRDGRITGVLDIDSPLTGRFTEADKAGLESFARILEAACDW
ncbi:MAG: GAF domain-containing protein [Treponema sp.]|nr:GAF domain-containing protein [Treponema sp.]